jgi:hypothetical protein
MKPRPSTVSTRLRQRRPAQCRASVAPADRAKAIRSVRSRRAGEIGADEAVELLIDDAIARQLGGAAAKDLEPKLREVLRDYAANDPYLAAKIRRLTQGK